jgi:hypothetical protein
MARKTITLKVYGTVDPKLEERRQRAAGFKRISTNHRMEVIRVRKPYACIVKPSTAATGKDLVAIAKIKRQIILKLAARGSSRPFFTYKK